MFFIYCAFIYYHLVLVNVYYHRIAVLRFSYHIIYSIYFMCIYLLFSLGFMSANTLETDTGNNYMYPKVISLYETVISICVYTQRYHHCTRQ